MGGGISLDFALEYQGMLEALVLISTGARLRVLPATLENLKKIADGEIDPQPFTTEGWDPTIPQEYGERAREMREKTDRSVQYADMMACDRFDRMPRLNEINIPTLILCGTHDTQTPLRYSRYFKTHIAKSKLEIFKNAGHGLSTERPCEFSFALESFLLELSDVGR